MSGGVPSPSRFHRKVRLCHYIIFRKTRRLFPLQLRLARPPTIIPELYALLLPPAHDRRVSWPPLLDHWNFKNLPRSNVLIHTVVTEGDVLPNSNQPRVHQSFTNGGVLGGYYRCMFWHQGIGPEIRCATQLCRLTNAHMMRGVMTHNFYPKTRTYWNTAA